MSNVFKSLLKDHLTISNYLCAVLALVLIIMQCLPFWSFDYEYTYDVEKEVVVEAEPAEEEAAAAEESEDGEAAEAGEAEEAVEAEPKTEIVIEEVTEIRSASLSLVSYEWLPTTEAGQALTEQYLKDKELKNAEGDNFGVNDIILAPVIQFVFALLVIGLCVVVKKNISISILSIISGGFGIWAYLTNPALMLGSNVTALLVLSILITLVGLVALVFAIIGLVDRRKRRLAALKNKALEM